MLALTLALALILVHAPLAITAAPSAHEPSSITFTPHHEYRLAPEAYSPDAGAHQLAFHVAAPENEGGQLTTTFTLKARPTTVLRPRSQTAFQDARLRGLRGGTSEEVEWDEIEVMGPYIEDLHTLDQLARMTGNAYALPGQKNWYDIDPIWNESFPFGWEDAADGFRGHVFLAQHNSTVILAIKGTTLQGPTSKKDKFNDNLLFSCCCARVDFSWVFSTVCGCYAGHGRCDSSCLTRALVEDSLFYNVGVVSAAPRPAMRATTCGCHASPSNPNRTSVGDVRVSEAGPRTSAVLNLINNLTALYPTSTIWLVGHSLGGSLASLLGATFGLPAVAFEAPGERLAAQRLHLPLPPLAQPFYNYNYTASGSGSALHPAPAAQTRFGRTPVTHVYHTADPIPQGACTGLGSLCAQAGFALETRCHLGRAVVFDTVGKLGWRVDVQTHTIKSVITRVLEAPVEGGWEVGEDGVPRDVPVAREEADCVDCYKWEFGDFKDSACGV
ncbi:hypothetical protein POSPLADRAFT_1054173 [Postia placenta MAD-698-R-SB12]|uniref:triacylglycerol lipase n=1 Tax=Postia placenta MAD-698-R-SB12 TaxID=670580 RepID=A0A1X6NAG1_9APHY|nr:hypothetical protein POSPLADRAFT_1054173 [Postia placenta MAD-698-R-SB12]OSX65426.1 hypothetical protein POSPLADRAFT_1054173 [Postia placenta MAD-698-R-SB12]